MIFESSSPFWLKLRGRDILLLSMDFVFEFWCFEMLGLVWQFYESLGLLCNFTKVGVLFIINLDACLAWRNGIDVESLMKMGPKG